MNVFQWVFVAFCVLQFCTSVYRFRRSHSLVALLFSLGWFISTILLLNPPLSTRIASIIGIRERCRPSPLHPRIPISMGSLPALRSIPAHGREPDGARA